MKIAMYKTSTVGWVLEYCESKIQTGTAARIGGNVAGSKQLVERIFNHVAYQRQSAGLKNRFIHLKLALAPGDKHVSSATFRRITEKVLQGLGFKNNPYLIDRHDDTHHPHLHVVICRVTFEGELIRDSFDGLKLKRIEQELDKEFNLTPSAPRLLTPKGVRLPQKWERERSARTGLKSVRNYIQCGIIESLQGNPSLTVFVKRLERRGIDIWHREISREFKTHHGLSYSLDPTKLKTFFKKDSEPAQVSGVDPLTLDSLSNVKQVETNHPYFGRVMARLMTSLRGIPEFCMHGTRPDNQMKPFSFRAANLGPYFQYPSVFSQLSEVDADTLEHITLRMRKPSSTDYQRLPLTSKEKMLTKLIVAAEIKSEARVNEALNDGLRLSTIQQLDRACTPNEIKFIERVIEVNAYRSHQIHSNKEGGTLSHYSNLVLQFHKLTGHSPDAATITAIGLVAEKKWTQLQEMLTSIREKNEYRHSPHSALMYMGISSSLSRTMIEYHRWFSSNQASLMTYEDSAERKRKQKDTETLLLALKNFDTQKVKAILYNGQPDVSKIPLEHLGKVTDTDLVTLLNKRAGLLYEEPTEREKMNEVIVSPTHHQQEKEKDRGYELG